MAPWSLALMKAAGAEQIFLEYEHGDSAVKQELSSLLDENIRNCEKLIDSFSTGRAINSGIPSVIIGKPNVGKSSLLNALLGYDRAIVTDVAGTTRDTVEEKLVLGHVLLRLTDTAGLRQSEDAVEKPARPMRKTSCSRSAG